MKLLEKILVPIDINIDSTEQLNTAIKIAKLCDSELFILHVLPEEGLNDAYKDIINNNASEILDQMEIHLKKEGIKVNKPIIEYGNAVDSILQKAVDKSVGLILTGSGSKAEKKKFKRGSTAAKLMRRSSKPVWVVKSDTQSNLSNILCPVDFSEPSKCALNNAILLSRFFNANLTILGVYEPYSSFSERFKNDIEDENIRRLKEIETKMNSFIDGFDLTGVTHQIIIKAGLPDEQILKSIEENKHDLLIMGSQGRSGLNRFVLGSVTEKVTRNVPCSFITTKTEDIIHLNYYNEIKEIEAYYNKANELFENKDYKEAIGKYLICLQINSLHIPSLFKVSKAFKIIGDTVKAKEYSTMAKDILMRLWDKKIEQEITQHFTS